MAPLNQLEGSQKELNAALSKYLKLLEKSFNPDIWAYINVDFEVHTVNNIIANHFYRQGLFDLGDMFVHECVELGGASLKLPFQVYTILEAMKARNLELALSWAAKNHDQLLQNGSMLEFKLYQLQFVEILSKGSRREAEDEALLYAMTHLVPFAAAHKEEFQKLMTCLLWVGRLDQSPYSELMSSAHWEKLAEELTHQFCRLRESPLSVAVSAAFQGLPTLLKLTQVMAAKKQEWQAMKQLPYP
jgi:hypothetical protein